MARNFFILSLFLVASGCGNYTSTTRQAREEFYSGNYTEAAKLLEPGSKEDGVDQLLFVLDRATALHQASQYDQSIELFHFADKLAEIKDYTSLSKEAATLISNDKIIPYKGEDFENVLISQYLALDYLMLGKFEDALVECRQVNHKLQMMISKGKRKYKLNPMANYLAALLYETGGERDHAYVDYQRVHDLLPGFEYLGKDLYRLAVQNKILEDAEKWATEFNFSAQDRKNILAEAKLPELVVLLEVGKSPEKHPHELWNALPKYVPRYNPISYADIEVDGVVVGRSFPLFNVEQTAIENLDEKFAGILAKKIAGVVVKEVAANEVGKRTDPLVGSLLKLGLYVADQADLRSWLTLPRDFQIFRYRMQSSVTQVKIKIIPKSIDGAVLGGSSNSIEKLVVLDSKNKLKKTFIPVRIL